MPNLLTSLLSSSHALTAYDQVLQVVQNNVANASTPGFARQRQTLQAMAFEPDLGLGGGVRAAAVQSLRNEYSERAVRRETVDLGFANQQVNSLTALESVFDVSGKSGIPKALNDLFAAFSAWGQLPNDTIAKQTVLDRADDVATAFNQTEAAVSNLAQDTERQLSDSVGQLNDLVGQIRDFNVRILAGSTNDSGLDAQLHATLEELSNYADITAIQQSDGSYQVTIDGQVLLASGDRQYKLSFGLAQPGDPPPVYPGGRPSGRILAADGADVTSKITTGQIGALLDVRNRILPSYIGDSTQPGDLNTMAKQLADRVNELLGSGVVTDGPPPQAGVPIFTYDASDPTGVARTMALRAGVSAGQLGPIDPGPPEMGNGVPLALAALSDSQASADRVNGATYSEFYGSMASRVGAALNQASSRQDVQQSAVAQAKELRQQMSGVSLDEEATILIQFQRGYEANSRLISILDQLTGDLIHILGQ